MDKKFDCWQQGEGRWLIVGQCCKTAKHWSVYNTGQYITLVSTYNRGEGRYIADCRSVLQNNKTMPKAKLSKTTKHENKLDPLLLE